MPDAYGTDSDFALYATATGRTATAAVPPDSVAAARLRASMFIDAYYGPRFSGVRTNGRDQDRAWPRTGAYDSEGIAILEDEVPIEVENATYEATLQELSSPGSLQPVVTSGQVIKKASVEGAVSVEFANVGVDDQAPTLTILDGILAPLLSGGIDMSSGLFGYTYRTS